MPENVIEQISSELRRTAAELYPNHGELKNVRLVGHTPKPEHYIYDIVIDFADGSERVAAKVYRNGKAGSDAKAKARTEDHNLRTVYKTFEKRILTGARQLLNRTKKALPSSAVMNDFTPLDVTVGEKGVGVCDYARMNGRGHSFHDVAIFLASVEALEKYPFCNRTITSQIQEEFINAYRVSPSEMNVLRVLKMKALLSMFARGRTVNVKESAVRKKVMWATVMKKFIQQAAQRSLAPAA